MSNELQQLVCDFEKLYITNYIENTTENILILDYVSPMVVGGIEIIDGLRRISKRKNQEIADEEKKKMAVITTMFALVKTFGKCCHNYLKEIEIISKSCSNPIVDAFVDNFLNNFYLKFHILIPKDPFIKAAMIIGINFGIWIGKYIFKQIKMNYLNQIITQEKSRLYLKKEDKFFEKVKEDEKYFEIKNEQQPLFQNKKEESKFFEKEKEFSIFDDEHSNNSEYLVEINNIEEINNGVDVIEVIDF
mgnify:CR=1 FL=1|jgi:hypothetical protein